MCRCWSATRDSQLWKIISDTLGKSSSNISRMQGKSRLATPAVKKGKRYEAFDQPFPGSTRTDVCATVMLIM